MMRALLMLVLLPTAASAGSVPAESSADPGITVERVAWAAPSLVQDTPPPPPRPRRRNSYVGYVGDATIGSQLRIRFDVASGVDAPDRAEFFYAKCGCYADLHGDPAFDPDAPGPRPGIVTDLNYRQVYLLAEYAPIPQFSVFAEIPARWIQPQEFAAGGFDDQSGLSDVRGGFKVALRETADQLVTLQAQAAAPTGEAARGLGTAHWSLETALLMHLALSDPVTVEGQVGAVFPINGSAGVPIHDSESFAGTVLYYGGGAAFALYARESWVLLPVVELVGWHVLEGFQTVPGADAAAEGINIASLKFGARLLWRHRHSIYAGFGTALTDDVWYRRIIRLEYRLTR